MPSNFYTKHHVGSVIDLPVILTDYDIPDRLPGDFKIHGMVIDTGEIFSSTIGRTFIRLITDITLPCAMVISKDGRYKYKIRRLSDV